MLSLRRSAGTRLDVTAQARSAVRTPQVKLHSWEDDGPFLVCYVRYPPIADLARS